MLLKNLIKNIPINYKNTVISGLSTDSRKIKKNYIFFAIKGNRYNGENFIKDAIAKGSSVIVCSSNCNFKSKQAFVIKTKDIRNFLSKIASKFFNCKPKNIFAVTGTNGKTSVADFFYQILKLNNVSVASIGTLGLKYNDKVLKTNLTSPDTISIHEQLDFLKKRKIENVIIEASSHGLDQKRLHNINFKAGIFTNFSQDHLDYHKTMRKYLNAKFILFKEILNKKSTVISDKEIMPFKKLKKISLKKNLKIIDIKKEFEKIEKINGGSFGDFKIKNLSMAIQAAKICGLKDKNIYRSIKKIKDVNGRLELVRRLPNNIKVFVDYAHTPDALEKILKYLKKKYGNNISLVFGCGGDRDKKKRPLMAKIANNFCRKIYITDDNPRNETPKKIRDLLEKNISKEKVFNIGNRILAIKKAIKEANPHEIILVAGKGHESKQIYKNKIFSISDKKIIKKINIYKRALNKKKQNFLQNFCILKEIFSNVKNINFHGLSMDTRLLKRNNLFIAIRGKKYDGNKFIKEALKKEAGCIISTSNVNNHKKILKVKNPTSFLNRFAELKRDQTSAKIIAITGSAGKTSLKNLIKNLLENYGKTYSSPKSYNNHFGVPISLSNLSVDDKFGVFEVGMSKSGEIKNLTKLIKPHIGVITNIGEAHIENFKNLNGIAKAKSEIIENIEHGGTIILNRDDNYFEFLAKIANLKKLKIITFGKNKKSNIWLRKIQKKNNILKIFINIKNKKIDFEIKDLNVHNVLASLAVLYELNVDFKKVLSKFKNLEPSKGRGKKYYIKRYNKKFKFIDESYNANPLSVRNAIRKLNLIKKKKFKKYLILGDMLELGSKSKKYHEDLSKVINNSDIDKIFITGKKTIFTYKHLSKAKRGNILQNIEDIDLSLNKMISNNDYLMIKGSNATGLHDFSKKIIRGI